MTLPTVIIIAGVAQACVRAHVRRSPVFQLRISSTKIPCSTEDHRDKTSASAEFLGLRTSYSKRSESAQDWESSMRSCVVRPIFVPGIFRTPSSCVKVSGIPSVLPHPPDHRPGGGSSEESNPVSLDVRASRPTAHVTISTFACIASTRWHVEAHARIYICIHIYSSRSLSLSLCHYIRYLSLSLSLHIYIYIYCCIYVCWTSVSGSSSSSSSISKIHLHGLVCLRVVAFTRNAWHNTILITYAPGVLRRTTSQESWSPRCTLWIAQRPHHNMLCYSMLYYTISYYRILWYYICWDRRSVRQRIVWATPFRLGFMDILLYTRCVVLLGKTCLVCRSITCPNTSE